ncbi:hypothetical protein PHYPO_G00210690 [Pangasianodon hypophthalmus]|uniref:Uncharacterized protein n=1 Tax=Pangasianodon hypophthalmus TaxID=310915 RepID=A0A5N5P519_PANHP|nr:hypothetical protein PHYPO_G00210690 [Pangasianodon hypophthalmus]
MRDPPSAAVGAAAAGAETPEKRCSNRAFLSALTRSAADRWLKAAQHLRLSPHGEENENMSCQDSGLLVLSSKLMMR